MKEINGISIDRIYSGVCFKKFVKKKGEYILIGGKEKDMGDIIKDKLKNSLKALLNPKRNKWIA